ncbi:hypothetical protein H0H93_011599 [Arthromyces matolae]|nr:hypothetical protein H0H93_011599 [Arthromyces matolae]
MSDSQVPNIAVVPLPPGFTLNEFYTLQSNLVTIAITAAIAFAIIVWDYFQSEYCEIGLVVSQIGAILVAATSGIAFAYRVMGVWGADHKIVGGIVGGLWIIMVAGWIAVATQLNAITGTGGPFGSNCTFHTFVPWTSLSQGLSFLYTLAILVLMLLKIKEQQEQPSIFLRRIYRDSLILISIATGANLTILIIHCLGSEYQLEKQVSLSFSVLLSATMGARIFLILRIAPTVSSTTTGRVPVSTHFQFVNTVTQRVDNDKPSYLSPGRSPAFVDLDTKISPSSYTSSPQTTIQKYCAASSPSSGTTALTPSPHTLHGSPRDFHHNSPIHRPLPTPPTEITYNPNPPSTGRRPQVAQIITRETGTSIDAGEDVNVVTPLLGSNVIPGGKKAGGKKEKEKGYYYAKSEWV